MKVVAIVLLAAHLCNTERICDTQDLVVTLSDCDATTQTRTAHFRLPEFPSCRAEGFTPFEVIYNGCTCSSEDFSTVHGDCSPQQTSDFRMSPSPGCAASPLQTALCPSNDGTNCGTTVCPCSWEDMSEAFTPCDEATRTKRRISFWKNRCEPGDIKLRAPSERIPCDTECAEGEYMPPLTNECVTCPEGQTAGLAVSYAPPWTVLPNAFYAHCSGKSRCEHWKLESEFVTSSPYIGATELRMYTQIRRIPAYVTFTYRITNKVLSNVGRFLVFVDGIYSFSAEKEVPWRTTSIDLIGRDACLWELKVSVGKEVVPLCLKQNHVIPYKPELAIPQRFEDLGNFGVTTILEGDACAQLAKPLMKLLGQSWVVIVDEITLKIGTCRWDEFLLKAAELKASAVILITERELAYEWGASSLAVHTLLNMPFAHLQRANLPDHFDWSHIGDEVSFALNSFSQVAEVQFYYEKLVSIDNTSAVEIQSVDVFGSQLAATECTDCPAGTFSSSKDSLPSGCTRCPEGYFSSAGAAACERCAHGVATPDRTDCINADCSGDLDYKMAVGECHTIRVESCEGVEACECQIFDLCKKYRRTVSFSSPCDPFMNLTTSPASQLIPCSSCPRGEYRHSVEKCTSCAVGSRSVPLGNSGAVVSHETGCAPCPHGVLPAAEYPADREWVAGTDGALCFSRDACPWQKRCHHGSDATCFVATFADGGNSSSAVSLLAGDGLHSVSQATQQLAFETIFLPHLGTASFAFSVEGRDNIEADVVSVRFSVYSHEQDAEVYAVENILLLGLNGIGTDSIIVTTPLLSGRNRLTWEYTKKAKTATDVLFSLKSLNLIGVADGGSDVCLEKCPPGAECSSDSHPAPCPPGTARGEGQASCTICEDGFYSSGFGATECKACPEYLKSAEGRERCVADGCKVALSVNGTAVEYSLVLGNTSDFMAINEDAQSDGAPGSKRKVTQKVSLCPKEWQQYAVLKASDEAVTHTIGRTLTVVPAQTLAGLALHLSDGDACVSNGVSGTWSAEISLLCGIGNTAGSLTEKGSSKCVKRYTLATPNACMKCKDNMWETVSERECINGFVATRFVQRVPCYGTPPPAVKRACTANSTSVDGVDTPEGSKQTNNLVTTIVVATVVPLAILCALGYVLMKRTKALEIRYKALTGSRNRSELQRQMEAVDVDDTLQSPAKGGHDVADDDDVFDGLQ